MKHVVLIVDSPEICQVMSQVLENEGMRCIYAHSSEDAAERYRAYKDELDLIIIDDALGRSESVRSEEGEGAKLILRLSDSGPLKARVLFTTGWLADPISTSELKGISCNIVLGKPFDAETLVRVVTSILEKPVPHFIV